MLVPAAAEQCGLCVLEDVLEVSPMGSKKSWCVWMRRVTNTSRRHASRVQPGLGRWVSTITNTSAGVSHLFMEGWRRVEVTERRTRVDLVKQLVDVDYGQGTHRAGDGT